MTSSEFVSFAATVSRSGRSWDDASEAFPGRPRWEQPSELEASVTSPPDMKDSDLAGCGAEQ
jgi:hypothetical protein